MNQALDLVSSREELLLKRMSKLHTEYAAAQRCATVTKNNQTRMEALMLQGEQAVDVLVGFIGKLNEYDQP